MKSANQKRQTLNLHKVQRFNNLLKNHINLLLIFLEIFVIFIIAFIFSLILILFLTYYNIYEFPLIYKFPLLTIGLLALFLLGVLWCVYRRLSFKTVTCLTILVLLFAFIGMLLYKDLPTGLFSLHAFKSNAFAQLAFIGEILLVTFYLLTLCGSWYVFSDYLKNKEEHFKKFLFLSSFVISFFIFSYVMSNVLLSLNQYIELNIGMITVDSIAAIFVSTALLNISKNNTKILRKLTYFVIILFLLTILITFRNVFTLPLGTRTFYIYNIVPTNTNMLVANAPNVGVVNITVPGEAARKMQILVNVTNIPVTGQFQNAVVINPLPFACAFNGNYACNFKNSAGFDGMFLVSVFLNIYNFVLLGILLYFASKFKS